MENWPEEGGFTLSQFVSFERNIIKCLTQLKNIIGLIGIGRGNTRSRKGEPFENWFVSFVEDIGRVYWGPGTGKKWEFPIERDRIRAFIRKVVIHQAIKLRKEKWLKKGGGRSTGKQSEGQSATRIDPSTQKSGAVEIAEIKLESSPPQEESEITRRLVIIDLTSEDEEANPSGIKDICLIPTKNLLPIVREQPSTVGIENEPNVCLSCRQQDSTSRDNGRSSFVLETSIHGSGDRDIRLIHSGDVPTPAHLRQKIHERFRSRLSRKHKIVGLKLNLGIKVFRLDIDDNRDREYISRVISKSDLEAKLIVFTSG